MTLKGLEIGVPERPSEGTAQIFAKPREQVVLRDVQPMNDHTAIFLPVVEAHATVLQIWTSPRDGACKGPRPKPSRTHAAWFCCRDEHATVLAESERRYRRRTRLHASKIVALHAQRVMTAP